MAVSPDVLWEINNEYRKRLSLLMGHMNLLEQILKAQGSAQPALRAAIRRIRATLEEIDADHHNWRHAHFYRLDENGDRRMVTEPDAVLRALETFLALLDRHLGHFRLIAEALADLPRPDPALTRVIRGGDLWQMCLEELEALATYDQFVEESFR